MQPVQASLLAAGLFLIPLLFRPEGGSDLVVKRLGLFILVTALAVVWAKRPVITRDDLLLPGICYVLLSIASTFWAPNPLSSVVEIAPLFIGLILLVAITSTVDVAGFLRACTALVIGGGVVGMIGIAQYFDIAPFTGIPSVGLPSATFGFSKRDGGVSGYRPALGRPRHLRAWQRWETSCLSCRNHFDGCPPGLYPNTWCVARAGGGKRRDRCTLLKCSTPSNSSCRLAQISDNAAKMGTRAPDLNGMLRRHPIRELV